MGDGVWGLGTTPRHLNSVSVQKSFEKLSLYVSWNQIRLMEGKSLFLERWRVRGRENNFERRSIHEFQI